MSKCKRCERKGLFLKINSDGLCNACAIVFEAEQQKNALLQEIAESESRLAALNANIQTAENALKEAEEKAKRKSEEYNVFVQKHDKLLDSMTKEAEVKALKNLDDQISALEERKVQLSGDIKKLTTSYSSIQVKYEVIKTKFESYKSALDKYNKYGSEI